MTVNDIWFSCLALCPRHQGCRVMHSTSATVGPILDAETLGAGGGGLRSVPMVQAPRVQAVR